MFQLAVQAVPRLPSIGQFAEGSQPLFWLLRIAGHWRVGLRVNGVHDFKLSRQCLLALYTLSSEYVVVLISGHDVCDTTLGSPPLVNQLQPFWRLAALDVFPSRNTSACSFLPIGR